MTGSLQAAGPNTLDSGSSPKRSFKVASGIEIAPGNRTASCWGVGRTSTRSAPLTPSATRFPSASLLVTIWSRRNVSGLITAVLGNDSGPLDPHTNAYSEARSERLFTAGRSPHAVQSGRRPLMRTHLKGLSPSAPSKRSRPRRGSAPLPLSCSFPLLRKTSTFNASRACSTPITPGAGPTTPWASHAPVSGSTGGEGNRHL
mmetsp:Transcript_50502/g.99365  ORF Transcript_50502/g.99365 Transcript_50502/m.99365 type:complete len:202 (-) Transcript_50502:891-1496(-)